MIDGHRSVITEYLFLALLCISYPERPTISTFFLRCSFAIHSPDKDSDVRVSARVLDLVDSGIGKGAVGVTFMRDLETAPVRGSSNFDQRCVFLGKVSERRDKSLP